MDETDVISSTDIDVCVQSLQTRFQVQDVGNLKFFEASYQIERLALAVQNPAVVGALRIHNRLEVLVEMLLAIEGWRTFVLPSGLMAKLEGNKNILRMSFILHTESTLITLINAMLYESCSSISEESIIALMDYCARSMRVLVEPIRRNQILLYQRRIGPAASRYQCALWDAEFRSCVLAATTLIRNFCESFDELSLGTQARLLETNDTLMLLVPLIEEPPWTRKRINGAEEVIWEKFIDSQWREVQREDLLTLTPCEGQCWISTFYLTCNNKCRARYGLTPNRKETLLKLQKFLLNSTIVSQLKILEDIKMYVSLLATTDVPDSATSETPMIEQIDSIRLKVFNNENWDKVAKDQFSNIFSKVTDAQDEAVHKFGLLHASLGVDLMIPPEGTRSIHRSEKNFAPKSDQVMELLFEFESWKTQINLSFRNHDGTTMETDRGTFTRRRLIVHETSPESPPIHPLSSVNVSISVNQGPSHVLRIESIDLPTSMISSREWRQLGSLEMGLVLQLGFKGRSDGDNKVGAYRLDKAFLGYPSFGGS